MIENVEGARMIKNNLQAADEHLTELLHHLREARVWMLEDKQNGGEVKQNVTNLITAIDFVASRSVLTLRREWEQYYEARLRHEKED